MDYQRNSKRNFTPLRGKVMRSGANFLPELIAARPGSRGVGHHSLSPSFGGLGSDAQRAMRWVQIIGAQQAQLFSAKGSVVRQCQHEPVAEWLGFG